MTGVQTCALPISPLYAAGEAPIPGISSEALAAAVQRIAPQLPLAVSSSMEQLADQVAALSQPGDLVLAMGAGDVNGLWGRLQERVDPAALPLAA